jgi:hypothetical protein
MNSCRAQTAQLASESQPAVGFVGRKSQPPLFDFGGWCYRALNSHGTSAAGAKSLAIEPLCLSVVRIEFGAQQCSAQGFFTRNSAPCSIEIDLKKIGCCCVQLLFLLWVHVLVCYGFEVFIVLIQTFNIQKKSHLIRSFRWWVALNKRFLKR